MAASDGDPTYRSFLTHAEAPSVTQTFLSCVSAGAARCGQSVHAGAVERATSALSRAQASKRNVENRCMSNMEQGLAPTAGAGDPRLTLDFRPGVPFSTPPLPRGVST
jgi:hypothetical protein